MTPARPLLVLVAFALGGSASGPAVAQSRARADVACRPAGATLQYDCSVRLGDARTNAPLTGAILTVGADMPSMPMAHSLRPVKALPAAEPGTYEARLDLEMHGDWTLRLDIAGPVRDRVVVPLNFDDRGARPAAPRAAPHRR